MVKKAIVKTRKNVAAKTRAKAPAKTKKAKRVISRSHRAAIGDALRSSILTLAQTEPKEARALLEKTIAIEAIESVSGRDVAENIGISKTSLYRDVLPECGTTMEEIIEGVSERIRSGIPASQAGEKANGQVALAGIWWLIPVFPGENDTGTATAVAAAGAASAGDHEAQVAASLYWHCWASKLAPGASSESLDSSRLILWLNPVGAILKIIASAGRPLPTDEELKAAPPALLAFAAYVAGEVLDSERKYLSLYDEERQKAAARFLLKLTEMGVAAAAKALVRCTRTAASMEASNACIQIGRKLAQRENDRILAERAGRPNDAPKLDPEIYKILSAVE